MYFCQVSANCSNLAVCKMSFCSTNMLHSCKLWFCSYCNYLINQFLPSGTFLICLMLSCRASKELLNTCIWEYFLYMMKVKVRTMDFSVLSVGHVKMSRKGGTWQIRYVCCTTSTCQWIRNVLLVTLFLMYQEDNPIPMFSESAFISSEQNEQRNSKCSMIFFYVLSFEVWCLSAEV